MFLSRITGKASDPDAIAVEDPTLMCNKKHSTYVYHDLITL